MTVERALVIAILAILAIVVIVFAFNAIDGAV
jgi:hypothetical protein